MKSLIIFFALGAAIGLLLPAQDSLAASGEVVSFVSLLMAGLLPAMILTATVIRGDRFSATRVRDYGVALNKQLDFWAGLFGFGVISAFCVFAAKIIAQMQVPALKVGVISILVADEVPCRLLVGVAFGALAVILVRLWPAYRGLRSVLSLSLQMAELQALANDRSLRDALDAKAQREYAAPTSAPWPENSVGKAER